MKIVLIGPPRSGKSCLRQALKDAIRSLPGAPYPYIITGCPDGEGSWFQETVNRDPNLATRCKAEYKSKFTTEFVRRVADSVISCSLPLTIVDLGGIPSHENAIIACGATHAVMIASDPTTLSQWWGFVKLTGLQVIAELRSDYHGTEDRPLERGEDGVLRGSVHHLERGERLADRPTVVELAKELAARAAE
jgi:CRISPR-associated protein Csx3